MAGRSPAEARGVGPKLRAAGTSATERLEVTAGADEAKGARATSSSAKASNARGAGAGAAVSTGKDRQVAAADGDATNELHTVTLDKLHFASEVVVAVKKAWQRFTASFDSRGAAGEQLYNAIFRSVPELQRQFLTPRAIQGQRFLDGIEQLVLRSGSAGDLLKSVENLGFMHLQLEGVTPANVLVFRDAVLNLVASTLGSEFTQQAGEGLCRLMEYAGGASVYVRTNYARRVRIVHDSWSIAQEQNGSASSNRRRDSASTFGEADGSSEGAQENVGGPEAPVHHSPEAPPDKGGKQAGLVGVGDAVVGGKGAPKVRQTTFTEMFEINAKVMGCSKSTMVWMKDVLESFDAIVVNISALNRLKEEIQVVALRMSKHAEGGSVDLAQFRACMLAGLRSLLPKHWSTEHEEAWCWMWDNVAVILQRNMGCLTDHERWLQAEFDSWDDAARFQFRKEIYDSFFELAPLGQDFFKQSNTRLHFIADRILLMTADILRKPKVVLSEISALGLRHVGYGIPTKLFPPFVNACVIVMQRRSQDEAVIEAFRWSLWLISQILVRTIGEGSTVVMQAINTNSTSQLKKAIGKESRGSRFQALLDVHVGEQHISPLMWAIESGSLKVADAILKDLLTIRADRDKYYYGVDELFERHPDIVKRICEEAPTLLPTLLDGLVWRSHRTFDTPDGPKRRCNIFMKHVLVGKDAKTGNMIFSDALKWISSSGDPRLVQHPVVDKMMDMLWGDVVYQSFILSRAWNMASLLVFILSQEVFEQHFEQTIYVRWAVFAGRVFTYAVGMGRLVMYHLGRIWTWCRNTMARIIEEIDTDGNGSIDREEMIEALSRFKDTVGAEVKKALRVLRDDDGPGTQEEARKAIANKEKNMYNIISFKLMLLLAIMLTHEPLFWCFHDEDWPTTVCPDTESLRYRYSVLAMMAMSVNWLILIDLAVFSTEISAFVLVLGEVISEVKQFLMAIAFLLLMFGSAISIMCRNCPTEGGNFSNMPNAIVTLFAITVSLYQGDFRQIQDDPVLLIAVFLFLSASVVLLLNLLIAQLNRSYEYIYQDMLGFARLNRAALIVDAMNSEMKKAKWKRYIDSLKFHERMEFDEGDLGLAGCIQLTESIRRYGGNTSPLLPWPEDRSERVFESNDERLDRIEMLIQKSIAKFQNRMQKQEREWRGSQNRESSNDSHDGAVSGDSYCSESHDSRD